MSEKLKTDTDSLPKTSVIASVGDKASATPKADAKKVGCASGRRKESIARVWLKKGKGDIKVNGKDMEEYFLHRIPRHSVRQPFIATSTEGKYDVICTVKGGGMSGQSGALRLAISKALLELDGGFRNVLKNASLLTRDSRVVERKKYGRHKARKKPQFSKR